MPPALAKQIIVGKGRWPSSKLQAMLLCSDVTQKISVAQPLQRAVLALHSKAGELGHITVSMWVAKTVPRSIWIQKEQQPGSDAKELNWLGDRDVGEATTEQVVRSYVSNAVNKRCRLDQTRAHQHSVQRPQPAKGRE